MHIPHCLGAALVATIGLVGTTSLPARSVQLADGTVYFEQPPSLVYSATTRNTTSAWGASYYFTIQVPANAGEPLQRITVEPQDTSNAVRRVEFDLEDSQAFVGTRGDRGEELALGNVTQDEDSQLLTVTFDPPVPAGTTVTLRLRPGRNPLQEGVYLFGVTAFPAGDSSHGQFLGYGRFNFYNNDSDGDLFPL